MKITTLFFVFLCALCGELLSAPLKVGDTVPDTSLQIETGEAAKAFDIAFQVPAELVSKYKNEYQIDLEAASGQTHHLLPHPAVYLAGRDGIIRFAHVNEDYNGCSPLPE